MKTSSIRYEELRRLLLDLHFNESHGEDYRRFEHSASGTIFLFRPYAPREHVAMHDVVSTRMHLDWNGLLSEAEFDDFLTKTPA